MQTQIPTERIETVEVPERLLHIYDPPQQLYAVGQGFTAALSRPRLAVVGSRRITPYGQQVTRQLAGQAAAQGITIISGLAYGVDAAAHQAALEAGGSTMAVLAGGLDEIYPRRHSGLADVIVRSGGCLISEYEAGTPPMKHRFIARNRLIAGLADAVLITEAAIGSGSLHTADFAMQAGMPVFAVPGNITAASSAGANRLIAQGATPVFSITDITDELLGVGHGETQQSLKLEQDEDPIILLVRQGIQDGDTLYMKSGLTMTEFNHRLSMLEITGQLRSLGQNRWAMASGD